MLMQVNCDSRNANNVAPSEEDIINIYSQYDALSTSRSLKDTRVHFIRSQSLREDKLAEFFKSHMWALP